MATDIDIQTPYPPSLVEYGELQELRHKLKDVILVGIDFEAVDHVKDPMTEKLSEVGISYIDLRNTQGLEGYLLEQALTENTACEHYIVDEWKHITAATCPARWHQPGKKSHKASPYTAAFCISVVCPAAAVRSKIIDTLARLSLMGRSDAEIEDGIPRQLIILHWDDRMERKELLGLRIQLSLSSCFQWDVQMWAPVLRRFAMKQRAGFAEFIDSLGFYHHSGVHGLLHNASNDAWFEAVAFARILGMTASEWEDWTTGRTTPLCYIIETASFCLDYNGARAPLPPKLAKKQLITAQHDLQTPPTGSTKSIFDDVLQACLPSIVQAPVDGDKENVVVGKVARVVELETLWLGEDGEELLILLE